VEGHDYRIQLEHKQKIFHAILLKRYFPADSEVPEDVSELSSPAELAEIQIQAVLWESDENLEEQGAEFETLNSLQMETVKDVQVNPGLSAVQQAAVRTLLVQYTDIFTDVPSITNVSEHVIQLTTTKLIKGRAYTLPMALRETLDKEIDNMLAIGIIEESTAAYASPVFMVGRPDGTKRVCVDYRKLNCHCL